MPNLERRLPKYAALAAPVLLFAANACTKNDTQPNQSPIPNLHTPSGEVGGVFATPRPTETVELNPQPTTTPTQHTESFEDDYYLDQTQTAKEKSTNTITNLEPHINRFGSEAHTSFKGNYAYAYTLITQVDPKIALPSLINYVSADPKLNAYIADPQTRQQVVGLYQEALNMEQTNPNNPKIVEKILDASIALKQACTTGLHKSIMRGNASLMRVKDKDFWQKNQFELLDSNCFDVKKYVISPEFPIKPLPNGTFVYEDVTYDDVISYSKQLQNTYRPETFANLQFYLQHGKDNLNNPNDTIGGYGSSANILVGACERSDVAFNTLRLLTSVEENIAQTDLFLRHCYEIFFNDQYYFDR